MRLFRLRRTLSSASLRSHRVISVGFVPIFLMLAVSFSFPQFPLIDFLAPLKAAYEWFVGKIVKGLLSVIESILIGITRQFLFFENPRNRPALTELYDAMTYLFIGMLSLAILAYALAMQIFPSSPKVDPYRFGERILGALVFVITGKIVLAEIIDLTQFVGEHYLYPKGGMHINWASGWLGTVMGGVGAVWASLPLAISLVGTILTSFIVFWVILAMRMLLIYTIYALFPLFMGLWIFDFGPGKYGKMIADLSFKIFAVLLAFGIIIPAILAVGSGLASSNGASAGSFDSGEAALDDQKLSSKEAYESSGDPDASFNSDASGGIAGALFSIFAMLGSIWLSIAVTSSALGMILSVSTGGAAASRIRRGGTSRATNAIQGQQGGVGQGQPGGAGRGPAGSTPAASSPAGSQMGAGNSAGTQQSWGAGSHTQTAQTLDNIDEPIDTGHSLGARAKHAGGVIKDKGGSLAEGTRFEGRWTEASEKTNDLKQQSKLKVGKTADEVSSSVSGKALQNDKIELAASKGSAVGSWLKSGADKLGTAGRVYKDAVISNNGPQVIGAAMRNSDIARPQYPDHQYPDGFNQDRVGGAAPEEVPDDITGTGAPESTVADTDDAPDVGAFSSREQGGPDTEASAEDGPTGDSGFTETGASPGEVGNFQSADRGEDSLDSESESESDYTQGGQAGEVANQYPWYRPGEGGSVPRDSHSRGNGDTTFGEDLVVNEENSADANDSNSDSDSWIHAGSVSPSAFDEEPPISPDEGSVRADIDEPMEVEDLDTVTVEPEEGITRQMEVATMKGTESGEELKYAGFGTDESVPSVSKGDVVELNDVKWRDHPKTSQSAHSEFDDIREIDDIPDGEPVTYMQAQADKHSTVNHLNDRSNG